MTVGEIVYSNVALSVMFYPQRYFTDGRYSYKATDARTRGYMRDRLDQTLSTT